MKKSIWLTYDLGVGGDYKNLYAWLDDNNAVDCGNNFAYLRVDTNNADSDNQLMDNLLSEIRSRVNLIPGNRLYVVRSYVENGIAKTKGSFIFGKRMSNPWEGYGSKPDESAEEG